MPELAYCCPQCKGGLVDSQESYRCAACNRDFPIIAGIADFRLYADPYIDLDADRAKGMRLAQKAQELSFADLVAFYYSITPEVPPDLARYYLNHHVAGVSRAEGMIERLRQYQIDFPLAGSTRVLDAGCGTGGFLAAAAAAGANAVGCDIAFRWLIVARKRLQELGFTNTQIVCACADFLPFEERSFDLIVAENLLEHTNNAAGMLHELERVRKRLGGFMARTVNRFAFGPEPHVGLWGVGYLPRPLMDGYVRKFKGIPYEHIHLQSYGSLRRILNGKQRLPLIARRPIITKSEIEHHPPGKRALFKIFDSAAKIAPPLKAIGPYIDITNDERREQAE